MVTQCTASGANYTGGGASTGTCNLLSETGTGIGNLLGSMQTALIAIILGLGVIGVVVFFVRKLGDRVGKSY